MPEGPQVTDTLCFLLALAVSDDIFDNQFSPDLVPKLPITEDVKWLAVPVKASVQETAIFRKEDGTWMSTPDFHHPLKKLALAAGADEVGSTG